MREPVPDDDIEFLIEEIKRLDHYMRITGDTLERLKKEQERLESILKKLRG